MRGEGTGAVRASPFRTFQKTSVSTIGVVRLCPTVAARFLLPAGGEKVAGRPDEGQRLTLPEATRC
ncbi:hypothetical protein N183_02850 [Sinorhizobium sp. Sb3]|nr:hypothetical protein N183_02850 [Sinorhizobium sp. Sb3]